MGCKEFMGSLVRSIAEFYGATDKESAERLMYEKIRPRHANGGFVELFMIIACECGEPVLIRAQPPDNLQDKLDAAIAAGELDGDEVKVIEVQSVHFDKSKKSDELACTNVGMTNVTCGECGAVFIACWEFEACEVEKDVRFPWDEKESPFRPASGLSFSPNDKGVATVH